MSRRAAVVVPTHDHATTLPFALQSALAQTVGDIEVHVIGDGVGDDTRDVVADFLRDDSRVRFHDLPKGPRLGEVYRHDVILGLDTAMVTYLCDDDLLLAGHIAAMEQLLVDADFAHPPPIRVDGGENCHYLPIDISLPRYRQLLLSGRNRIPLTGAAHTVAAYRRLPHGWRTTPVGISTDLYMWQQFLAQPWCRAVTGSVATAVSFPSPTRPGWTAEQRGAELARWYSELSDPAGHEGFDESVRAAYRAAALDNDRRIMAITSSQWWRTRVAISNVLRHRRARGRQ